MDGIENPKVQSVYFPDTPLHKAAFANDGAQVSLLQMLMYVYLCVHDRQKNLYAYAYAYAYKLMHGFHSAHAEAYRHVLCAVTDSKCCSLQFCHVLNDA